MLTDSQKEYIWTLFHNQNKTVDEISTHFKLGFSEVIGVIHNKYEEMYEGKYVNTRHLIGGEQ